MGVFSKLKGIFYDEVVVDEDEVVSKKEEKVVKKEVIKEEKPKIEEIKVSVREEIKEEEPIKEVEKNIPERELFRSERTFNFTEFDEEEDLPPRKSVLDVDNNSSSRRTIDTTPPKPPKVFKPSPIISPIYGILDKDYKREEIKERQVTKEVAVTSTLTTYDTVRRKAYGTLEDDLEDTLNSMNKLSTDTISDEITKIDKKITELEELEKKAAKIEDLINKIEESTELDRTSSIGELEDSVHLENFDDDDEDDITDKTITDSTLEHDLFNLIDSMYDDKED